jgi:archaellum component FlaC
MSNPVAATREDIDDVLNVLDVMMTKIDERFNKSETNHAELHRQMQSILNHLDSLEKRLEISEDERLVMAHQLTRLHDWVERAAERINIKFAH